MINLNAVMFNASEMCTILVQVDSDRFPLPAISGHRQIMKNLEDSVQSSGIMVQQRFDLVTTFQTFTIVS